MERLTKWNGQGEHAYYPRCFDECDGRGCRKLLCDHNILVCDRLAAYEDTGLEPGEIKELSELKTSLTDAEQKMLNDYLGLGSIDRLRKLTEADKDGRRVVLPIPFGKGKEIYGIAEDDYDSEVPKSVITICCDELDHVEIWPSGEMVVTADGWEIGQSDVGKTVFLTREAAEAALEEANHA